jgi:hypothetical protein
LPKSSPSQPLEAAAAVDPLQAVMLLLLQMPPQPRRKRRRRKLRWTWVVEWICLVLVTRVAEAVTIRCIYTRADNAI